jgi:hypothetical protein
MQGKLHTNTHTLVHGLLQVMPAALSAQNASVSVYEAAKLFTYSGDCTGPVWVEGAAVTAARELECACRRASLAVNKRGSAPRHMYKYSKRQKEA